jgi:hypothetical protein
MMLPCADARRGGLDARGIGRCDPVLGPDVVAMTLWVVLVNLS